MSAPCMRSAVANISWYWEYCDRIFSKSITQIISLSVCSGIIEISSLFPSFSLSLSPSDSALSASLRFFIIQMLSDWILGDLVKIILPMTRAQALRPYGEFAITLFANNLISKILDLPES